MRPTSEKELRFSGAFQRMVPMLLMLALAIVMAQVVFLFRDTVLPLGEAIEGMLRAAWGSIEAKVGPTLWGFIPLTGLALHAVSSLAGMALQSDGQVLCRCEKRFGSKFRKLFSGNFVGDRFLAEKEFCGMLAWATNNDRGRIDRIFRSSGLFSRERWNRPLLPEKIDMPMTHGERVILCSLRKDVSAEGPYSCLEFVMETSVILGFMGTCLGLMATLSGMTAGGGPTDLIAVVVKESAAAFGSTVAGLILYLATYSATWAFSHRLVPRHPHKPDAYEKTVLESLANRLRINDQEMELVG